MSSVARQGSSDEQRESDGVRPNCVRPGSIDERSESIGVRPSVARQGSSDEQRESDGVRPNCVRPSSIDERSESNGVRPSVARSGSAVERSESAGVPTWPVPAKRYNHHYESGPVQLPIRGHTNGAPLAGQMPISNGESRRGVNTAPTIYSDASGSLLAWDAPAIDSHPP